MSVSNNFPNIQPSLNLSFALTKRLDPRITFTRTTTATYYDGVTTAKAEENLILRSQDYSATWTVTDLTPVTGKTAPDGTSTATEFTASSANGVLTQGFTAVAGSYTFSVFLRRVTGSGDIEIAADNGTFTVKVITGTWARYDVTQTVAAGSKTAGVRVVTSGDVIEVWGAQLEQRSSVTAYTPTTTQAITNYIPVLQTAASGVARFDHNPTTGESLGLLVEEQRTNLQVYSQEFDNAAWTKTRSSITANTIVAPSGELTGDKLVEDTTASNSHFISQSVSFTSGTTYSFSVYAKAGERTHLQLILVSTAFGANLVSVFDLIGATSTQSSGSTSITSVGNGWYRCTFTAAATITASAGIQVRLADSYSTTASSYTGNGYSGIYIWGAQLEAGAFPTSYIATTSASVTRNADAASMTGTNFSSWFNNAEGTFYTDFAFTGLTGLAGQRVVVADDGSTTNYIGTLSTSSSTMQNPIVRGGVTEATLITPATTFVANTFNKISVGFKNNNSVVAVNNVLGTADTSCLLPVSLTTLRFGASSASATSNILIRKIAYYPIRCTNAQLQALTS